MCRYAAANPNVIKVRRKKHAEGHQDMATHYRKIEEMVASVAREAKPFEDSLKELIRQRAIEVPHRGGGVASVSGCCKRL